MIKEIELLKKYDDAYYNGTSLISDLEYDNFREEVFEKYPNDPYFNTIGASVNDKTQKVKIPYVLGSLKKYKPKNINKYFSKFSVNESFIITSKLDGLSIYVEYENGTLKLATTRGNGFEGYDITKKAKYFLPFVIDTNEKICLRGEVLLTGDKYKELGFSNRRNGASGIINRDGYKNCEYLYCMFYELINSEFSSKAEELDFISSLGLKITPFKIHIPNEDMSTFLVKELKTRKEIFYDYDIDGLVISPDNYKRENVLRPENKIAFKVNAEGEEVEIDHLEWNITRTGRLVPLAILKEPIDIDGSMVRKATAHNLEYVKNNQLGTGSIIKIVKSGDIIPYITEVVEDANFVFIPNSCPSCGSCLQVDGVDLVCKNSSCPEQNIYFLEYFFKTLGAENISAQTFRNLEVYSLEEVFSLTKEYISNKEGFGIKSANMIISEIQKCLFTTVEDFITAIGINNFGKKNVVKFFDTINQTDPNKKLLEFLFLKKSNFLNINGLGEKIYNSVYESLDNVKEIFDICKKFGLQFKQEEVKQEQKLRKISATGKGPYPRKQLETILMEKGYELVDLGKDSELLLCSDKNSTSSKMKKASKLGIEIKTYIEFFGE